MITKASRTFHWTCTHNMVTENRLICKGPTHKHSKVSQRGKVKGKRLDQPSSPRYVFHLEQTPHKMRKEFWQFTKRYVSQLLYIGIIGIIIGHIFMQINIMYA